ncbi:MAG: tRNA (adenosine(37)-N6)-dimethylallyltransferase MiaA [Rhodospirillaceae bacterium]|jgi:tRNA dimethylallyltransferase|nr:tRNA (adenosine(37)-N6)-dimethylallyltransferase MiaA [Rhodospirillaceae bacterium]MBT7266877.1 tRNA (adenosine(37)-N6)-dimethylallyltransferase MiaA [Rhodospirillaceae bacterium]
MNSKSQNPILIIAGPTASGKSGLALAAADKYDGVIINCDSMQVYAELRLITARPSIEDEAKAPHKLYGVIPASKPCSAGIWRDLALPEIEACWAAGKLPIITGGTGLYIKALMEGLTEIPDIPSEIREEATQRREQIGFEAFHQELGEFDSVSAERLNPTDSQRVIRAYEVYLGTERSLSDWHKDAPTMPPLEANYQSVIFEPPRDVLYAKCEARFDWMMEHGALDEVTALMDLKLDPTLPAMKALGVPDLIAYLNQEISLEEAVLAAKQATRRYAKRQMTWFRNQIVQDHRVIAQYSERLLPEIFAKIVI